MIAGCGFGGLTLAKKLRRLNAEILLIDRNNYHTFQPLLYQVATGGLEAENIVYPVRRIFRNIKNVTFRMAEVLSVDATKKLVRTNIGNIPYDHLVLALGSSVNYFNFDAVKDLLIPLKSLTDALHLRSYLMQNLERSLVIANRVEQEEAVNVAIIGGGPTGLELAGAIAEMKKYVLPLDFPELDLTRMHIVLFEMASRLLGTMSEKASLNAARYLERLGVTIKTGTRVKNYDGTRLTLENDETFRTDTVIWTAGVKVVRIGGLKEQSYLPDGRLLVDACNRLANHEDIFVLGDGAACITDEHPHGLPMLAPVAMQQAEQLASNLKSLISGKPLKPFRFRNKGVLATIGRKRAVADLPRWKFHGLFAWIVWMFVHIRSLIGFRNKILTLFDWSANYFNYDKPLGIIIPPFRKSG